jgi:hypothetical protein
MQNFRMNKNKKNKQNTPPQLLTVHLSKARPAASNFSPRTRDWPSRIFASFSCMVRGLHADYAYR